MVDSAREYAIFSLDHEGHILTWNAGAERLFLYSPEEILGHPADIIFTPDDRAAGVPQREFRLGLSEGRAQDDRWHVRRDGTRFWANGLMMALRGEYGEVIGLVKIVQDRTDERRVEQALRRSEDQFARLVMGSPAATIVVSRSSGTITLVNDSFLKLCGYWRAEVVGESLERLGFWEDTTQMASVRDELDALGESEPRVIQVGCKDGSKRTVLATFKHVEAGEEEAILGILLLTSRT